MSVVGIANLICWAGGSTLIGLGTGSWAIGIGVALLALFLKHPERVN